jgi:hypothetical protein
MEDTSGLQLMLASMILIAIGGHFLYKTRHWGTISVIDIAVWMGAVYFGLGPWVAYFAAGGHLPIVEQELLIRGYIAIWLYFLGLIAVQFFTEIRIPTVNQEGQHEFIGRLASMLRDAGRTKPGAIIICYAIVLVVRTILALGYGILFSSSGFDNVAKLPYLLVMFRLMCEVVAGGCLLWACAAFWLGNKHRGLVIFILAVEAVYNFMQGRRWMMSYFILIALAHIAVRGKIRFRYLALGAAVAALFWAVLMPAFIGIRKTVLWAPNQTGEIVTDVWNATVKYYDEKNTPADDTINRELKTRPLIAGFIFQILECQDHGGPMMMGRAIGAGVIAATPRYLFPGTKPIYDSELYVLGFYAPYGMPGGDTDSTWVAEPVADFGVIGGLMGGLILGSILAVGERIGLAVFRDRPWVGLCVTGAMVSIAFLVEQNLEATWELARNSIFLIIIAKLITPAQHTTVESFGDEELAGYPEDSLA